LMQSENSHWEKSLWRIRSTQGTPAQHRPGFYTLSKANR
jgi:hypothetical protein